MTSCITPGILCIQHQRGGNCWWLWMHTTPWWWEMLVVQDAYNTRGSGSCWYRRVHTPGAAGAAGGAWCIQHQWWRELLHGAGCMQHQGSWELLVAQGADNTRGGGSCWWRRVHTTPGVVGAAGGAACIQHQGWQEPLVAQSAYNTRGGRSCWWRRYVFLV